MEEKKEKLTYEQLKNIAAQLQHRCAELENKLRSIDITAMRLNYLLEVLKVKDAFPKEFIDSCINNVMEILTPPKEDAEPKE